MNDYAVVSTKKELEQALKRKADKIIVTDPDLARNIKSIKLASRAALTTVLAGMVVAATNFWNPIGWGAGLVGAVSSGTIIAAIVALGFGAALVWIMYNDYTIKAKCKVKMPDGTEIEGEVILERN